MENNQESKMLLDMVPSLVKKAVTLKTGKPNWYGANHENGIPHGFEYELTDLEQIANISLLSPVYAMVNKDITKIGTILAAYVENGVLLVDMGLVVTFNTSPSSFLSPMADEESGEFSGYMVTAEPYMAGIPPFNASITYVDVETKH